MARVVLSGFELRIAEQIEEMLRVDGHDVRRLKKNAPVRHLADADLIFAGGEAAHYLPALRRLRAINASVGFVIISRRPRLSDWLQALEAGVTDYWLTPFDMTQIRTVIAMAVSRRAKGATFRS